MEPTIFKPRLNFKILNSLNSVTVQFSIEDSYSFSSKANFRPYIPHNPSLIRNLDFLPKLISSLPCLNTDRFPCYMNIIMNNSYFKLKRKTMQTGLRDLQFYLQLSSSYLLLPLMTGAKKNNFVGYK